MKAIALASGIALCSALAPQLALAHKCGSRAVQQPDTPSALTPEDVSSRAGDFLLTPASVQMAQAAPKRRCPGGRYMGRCIQ
jgi:hypothetical protein